MKRIAHLAHFSLFALLIGFLPVTVLAEVYPSKPIRIVAPFPPGGPADILSRIIGHKLSQSWGQQAMLKVADHGEPELIPLVAACLQFIERLRALPLDAP